MLHFDFFNLIFFKNLLNTIPKYISSEGKNGEGKSRRKEIPPKIRSGKKEKTLIIPQSAGFVANSIFPKPEFQV